MLRKDLAHAIATLVGGSLTITDARSGWPALGTVETADGPLDIALFAGPIGSASRPERVDIERRFQNPAATSMEQTSGWQGRPIEVPPGRTPLLLGLWTEDERLPVPHPVLVSANAHKRTGLTTRYSVFQRPAALQEASTTGWTEGVNDDSERMVYFEPRLLPIVALAAAGDVPIPVREVAIAVDAAGLADSRDDEQAFDAASERARRSGSALVRDARFSKDIVNAYEGRCAMCGLGLRLVQGAHVYPASAPGSQDKTWNGLCLCGNHHDAFDRHLIWVDPASRAIRFHPDVHAGATDPATSAFIASTARVLREPTSPVNRPRQEMFEQRYALEPERYTWVDPDAML